MNSTPAKRAIDPVRSFGVAFSNKLEFYRTERTVQTGQRLAGPPADLYRLRGPMAAL